MSAPLPTPRRRVWSFSASETLLAAIAAGLIIWIGALAWREARAAIRSVRSVQHTFSVLIQIDDVDRAITDAWLGQRNYLLTQDPRHLESYGEALGRIKPELEELETLSRDNNDAERAVAALRPIVDGKLADMAATLEKARVEGPDAADASLRADVAKARIESIRAVIDELSSAEHAVLLERLAVRDGRLRSTVALTATLGVLSFVVFAAVLASLNRSTRRRMVAEDAANQSAEQLRVTLQSIGDAVIATDLGGRIVFMNPIAQSLTGWRERDAVGTPLFEVFRIVNEFTRETVESPVTKVLREGTIVGLANHTLLIARDGSERPIDDSGAPIRDAQGQLIGVVLVFRDVTARRLTEQSRERLLRAEAERSTAESANRAKDQFLAVVSHELRAPLTAALSWVDLLEAGVLKEGDRTRALATIGRNLRLQSTLISDLLDVSRIAAGKLTIERVPVDVAALVQSAVESFGAEAATKKMALRFDSSGPLIALADPGRIEQIVANLVSNAIRFTPESGTVHVALAAGAGELQISVRDTGTGIAPEFLPRVFDRFTQAENPTVRGHGGLGLGLSIAKHLVELHGGTIRAESDGDGLGATFTVTLPVHDGPSAPPERPATDPAQPLTNVLILLVEDHEDTREALAFRLRARGARVAAAGSVAEGLQLYRSQRPALLISDVALPGENGFTLIRQVREAEAAAGIHTPAIAVSGFVSGEDRREALGAGFDDHVGKPIDFAALLERVRTLLARD